MPQHSLPSPVAPSILIVDDDAVLLAAFTELLEAEGYCVFTARSAEEATEILRDSTFHVALCDLQLPGQSGLALLRTLRERCPETACVLITGHGSIRNAVTALKRGAVEFIVKPVQPRRLLRLCRALVACQGTAPTSSLRDPAGTRPDSLLHFAIGTPIETIEREVILRTLEALEGNKTAAAETLGISRRSIYNKLAGYGLKGEAAGGHGE